MRNLKRVIYTSSYDYCNYVNNMIRLVHEKSRQARKVMQRVWQDFITSSVCLRKKNILLYNMQRDLARKTQNRLLERKENAFVSSRKNEQESCRHFGEQEPKMERWKTNRQKRLHSYMESPASLFGLSWVRPRTQVSIRNEFGQIFRAEGGSTS